MKYNQVVNSLLARKAARTVLWALSYISAAGIPMVEAEENLGLISPPIPCAETKNLANFLFIQNGEAKQLNIITLSAMFRYLEVTCIQRETSRQAHKEM